MEEKMNILDESDLESVSGGAGSTSKKIRIINCTKSCNVRAEANDQSAILGQAPVGTSYRFHGWHGRWAQITYTSKIGYVNKKFIEML